MRSLAELLGAYGVRHFSRKLVSRIISEVEELKVVYSLYYDVFKSFFVDPQHLFFIYEA